MAVATSNNWQSTVYTKQILFALDWTTWQLTCNIIDEKLAFVTTVFFFFLINLFYNNNNKSSCNAI